MRRIAAVHAREGMVLGRPVYDSYGYEIIEMGTKIDAKVMRKLEIHMVPELVVRDWRVEDVPVQPLVSPEHAGMAVQALRTIMTESRGSLEVDPGLLEDAAGPVFQMTRELFPEVIGEVNASGCLTVEDYPFVQPAKVAELSMLMARRLGFGVFEVAGVGMAALLKDVGMLALPEDAAYRHGTAAEPAEARKHPLYSAEVLYRWRKFGEQLSDVVASHHERWNGTGYPRGLVAEQASIAARVLAIADTYYELVSRRPHRRAYMPHEAVEYIMAFSGELFDPKLVELFTSQVPLYPTGVTVRLNTGEVGIVSDSNPGYIGRPVVRICFDENTRPVAEPYDLDLSQSESQERIVTQVLSY